MCLNNMLGLAGSLGCKENDLGCLCSNKDFGYGIHDCTVEACPDENVAAVESYAQSLCASAGMSNPLTSDVWERN